MNAEFKVGDKVTYKPYEESHDMVVIAVRQGRLEYYPGTNEVDERWFYSLSKGGYSPVTSITTGASIVESILFEEHDKNGETL